MHKMTPLAAALLALPSLAAAQFVEDGDAPSSPLTPQVTIGSGPLTTISGATFTIPDDPADAYLITISDPANFYATLDSNFDPAAGTSNGFDSRLFLFDAAGIPVLANDDNGGSVQSLITDPASFPGTVRPTAEPLTAGDYVLVVAGFEDDPVDADGLPLFGVLGLAPTALFGPDPAAGPFAGFESDAGFITPDTGGYTVALNGATFAVPEPATAGLLAVAAGLGLARRRAASVEPTYA